MLFTEKEKQIIEQNNLHMARVAAAHRLRNRGLSLRQIGRAMDLSHERIRQLLQEKPVV